MDTKIRVIKDSHDLLISQKDKYGRKLKDFKTDFKYYGLASMYSDRVHPCFPSHPLPEKDIAETIVTLREISTLMTHNEDWDNKKFEDRKKDIFSIIPELKEAGFDYPLYNDNATFLIIFDHNFAVEIDLYREKLLHDDEYFYLKINGFLANPSTTVEAVAPYIHLLRSIQKTCEE